MKLADNNNEGGVNDDNRQGQFPKECLPIGGDISAKPRIKRTPNPGGVDDRIYGRNGD